MVLWIGHTRPWKKIGAISRMSKIHALDGAFFPPRTHSIEHGLVLAFLEMTPNFASRRAWPWYTTRPVLNDFWHHMQVATRPAIYLPFLSEKTPENAKNVKNQNNMPWCLELVIEDGGNFLGLFEWCRETMCSQREASGQHKHPPLSMV